MLVKPADSSLRDTRKSGEQGKELQTGAEQKRQKPVEQGGAGDGEWRFGFIRTASCQDSSASKIWKSVQGLKTLVWGSGHRLASHEQQPRSSIQRGHTSVTEQPWWWAGQPFFFFSFSLPLARANTPMVCRMQEETLQSLTCLHSTFVPFNKNKSHVALPNCRKPPEPAAACAPLSSCLFSSWSLSCGSLESNAIQALLLHLQWYLILFDLGFWFAAGLFVALCPARWQRFMTSEVVVYYYYCFLLIWWIYMKCVLSPRASWNHALRGITSFHLNIEVRDLFSLKLWCILAPGCRDDRAGSHVCMPGSHQWHLGETYKNIIMKYYWWQSDVIFVVIFLGVSEMFKDNISMLSWTI